MKKIVAIIICAVILISLSSCHTEYVDAENKHLYNETNMLANLTNLSCDMAMDMYFDYYPTDDTVIFFPISGDHTTKDGKKFTAVIGDSCDVFFVEDTTYSRICYDIEIYDENGSLILQKKDFCSYVHVDTKALDFTYVSEEFRPYWQAMTTRSDEIKR